MSYTTIWSGRNVRAALTVTQLEESPKAIKFVVADNAKCVFWLPKKGTEPSNVYEEGEWGYITVNKQKVFVHGSNNSFEIWR